MNEPRVAAVVVALLCSAGCGGLTSVSPTSPSATAASPAAQTVLKASPPLTHAVGPDAPAGTTSSQQVITGTVGPAAGYPMPCYEEQYACERYQFTLQHDGAAEVTLSWQGGSRAMLIQLYRYGAGLMQEDLAPKDGPSTITFRRTDLPGIEYELRVVNMEPDASHPFTLTLTTWQ